MANKAVVQLVIKGKDVTAGAFRRATRGLRRFGRAAFEVGKQLIKLGALAAAAGTALTLTFIKAASTSENFRVRLNALLGDAERGNRVFQDMAKFASKVSFSYEEIMGSATALAGVVKEGTEEINQLMPMIADLAAVSGLSIQETTSQVIRMYSAGAAAADMFRERGILSMLGFQAGVSVSAEATMKQMIEAWEAPTSKFRGASNELAKTWTGLLSMMGDRWFIFRNMVADAGLFDVAKAAVQSLLNTLDRLTESGRLAEIAQTVSNVILTTIQGIITAIGGFRYAIQWVTIQITGFFGRLPGAFEAARGAILGALAGILRALADFVLDAAGILASLPGPLGDIFASVGGVGGAMMAAAARLQEQADAAKANARAIFAAWREGMNEELALAREDFDRMMDVIPGLQRDVAAAAAPDALTGLVPQLAGGAVGIGLRAAGGALMPGEFGLREEQRAQEAAAAAFEEAKARGEELDRVMSDIVSGSLKELADGFADAFEKAASGAISLGDALKQSMLGAVATIAKAMAQFFMAQALAALGMGIFLGPFGAAKGIAAAAKLTAAAIALSALSGAISALAGGGAGGGQAAALEENPFEAAGRGKTTIIFESSFINLADPSQRKMMQDMISELGQTSDSEIVVRGG